MLENGRPRSRPDGGMVSLRANRLTPEYGELRLHSDRSSCLSTLTVALAVEREDAVNHAANTRLKSRDSLSSFHKLRTAAMPPATRTSEIATLRRH